MSSPVELDPQVAQSVAGLHGSSMADFAGGTGTNERPKPADVEGVTWVDDVIQGSDVAVRVRRYETSQPSSTASSPRAGVVWCHGGGWVNGDLDTAEAHAVAQRITRTLDAITYSVDYRLAPAHRFPAPVDDILAVVGHLIEGRDPEVDPSRVVLGGASAGAHLSACAAHRMAAEATGRASTVADPAETNSTGPAPDLAALFLAYPATDPIDGPFATTRPRACPELLWFDQTTTSLLFSLVADPSDRSARPLRLDPTGLPPTLITHIPADALSPQAEAYAEHIARHGVDVASHRVDGVLHGYLDMVGRAAAVDTALDRHLEWLAAVLSRPHDI